MRMGDRARALCVSVIAATLMACGGSSETPQPQASGGGGATPPPPPPAEARDAWAEDSFELRSSAAGPYTAGQAGTFEVRLTPRGNYHVNQDYPMTITLTGPDGVTFPSATVERAAATAYTEQLATFAVPFTAPAGQHDVRAVVDFAVCTPEACMPDTRTLAVHLAVQ